jgi:predicted phosphodiesterase
MRLVLLSDTHCRHADLAVPDGDVLIHAGDFTRRGTEPEIRLFTSWLATLPHRVKVVVAGNHDFLFERDPARARALVTGATYLEDSGVSIDGVTVWGSPWQPRFFDWAFNLERGAPLRAKWQLIPSGTQVLVTHGPPMGVLDRTWRGTSVGCVDLADAVARVKPRLHVFGHIHESHGELERDGVRYVNAANCDERDHAVHPPVVVDL